MGLRESLNEIDVRLGGAVDGLRTDVDMLKEKLANVPVPEDVSDVLESLDSKVALLESLDAETPVDTGGDTGPNPNPEPEPIV